MQMKINYFKILLFKFGNETNTVSLERKHIFFFIISKILNAHVEELKKFPLQSVLKFLQYMKKYLHPEK